MVGHGVSGSGGGGVSPAGLAGYATQAWVAQNFLSIDFFNKLFKAHSATGDVLPNDTDTAITDIEALFGFWTNQYISALGKNSSGGGGGGGGSSTLAGLDDVQFGTLANGQALVYDSASGKWVNGTVIPDLTDYATKSWVQQQGYLTASALTGYATESWVNDKGYVTELWVTGKGYATETWVEGKGYALAANVYSKTDADAKFLTVAFFNRLFQAYNGTTSVNANDTTSTIDNIKAMFGFWTNQYISALGKNSSGGGGGGGSSTLAGLDDVQFGTLANGQALVYDSASGKWVNGTVIPDLTDYATKSWVQQQGYLTASALTGYATESWVTGKGYATESWVTGKGYATETWVEGKGYALAANVYSKTDADAKFLTVAFFNRLFQAYNGATSVNANDTTSTIDNIKAMFGFWTNQYISALGKNSSGGGGGGGSSTLAGLNDVQFGTLANGQALVYDSASGKWVNGTVTPDLTDYATKVWVQQQGYLTQHQSLAGYATESWVQQQGYLTQHQSLVGYATESWVEGKGYLTAETDPTVPAWAKAATKPSYAFSEIGGTVAFSQLPTLYWANVPVGSSSDSATTPTFSALNVTNDAIVGGSVNAKCMELSFSTPFIDFHHAVSNADFTSRFITTDYGVMSLQSKNDGGTSIASAFCIGEGFTGSYLQIGNIRVVYDSTNNALQIIKNDGTPAGLYATGGLSALGMSAGAGGEGSFSKLGVSGDTTLNKLTVNGVTSFSQSVTFSRLVYFDDDIVINVGGTEMYLDTSKCVELGILS